MALTCEACVNELRDPASGLCPESLRTLHWGVRRAKLLPGERLFTEGEEPTLIFMLHSGTIKLFRDVEPGRVATVRLVGPGEFFGTLDILAGLPYCLSAEAVTAAELCVFQKSAFQRTLDSDPDFARLLLRRTAEDVRAIVLGLLHRSEHDAASKIASRLVELAEAPTPRTNGALPVNRGDLSELTGSAQETVSRVLGRLVDAGLIEREGRKVRVRDLEGLRRLAQRRRNAIPVHG